MSRDATRVAANVALTLSGGFFVAASQFGHDARLTVLAFALVACAASVRNCVDA